MKILELFAGSRSLGKVAEELGHEVFSVDIENFDKIDLAIDIEKLTPDMIPFKPDMIWASIPCTSYTIAAISHHRDGVNPKSGFAWKSDRLSMKTLELIEYYDCMYFIENPRGMFRKMPFIQDCPRS